MAPDSRIILLRHAQAEHNVDLDFSIPDAPLTALGHKQASSITAQLSSLQPEVDVIISSPLKRTLQTTLLSWAPAVQRLGRGSIICLPQAQECDSWPCDTGSAREILEAMSEFAGLDFSRLPPDWTSKRGFWAADTRARAERAQWVRQFLRERPERTIVLVAHGDVLREITCSADGPSTYPWKNAEARMFAFDPDYVATNECYLSEKGSVAVTEGYALSSTA